MGEEERRRCCLLGGCGCGPPGSQAQRQAMREWLAQKLASVGRAEMCEINNDEQPLIDTWLDELPWTVTEDANNLSDPTGGPE